MEVQYNILKAVECAGLSLFLVDWLVNAPMNGLWRLPGHWTKDDTIGLGVPAALVGGIFLTFLYDVVGGYKPLRMFFYTADEHIVKE